MEDKSPSLMLRFVLALWFCFVIELIAIFGCMSTLTSITGQALISSDSTVYILVWCGVLQTINIFISLGIATGKINLEKLNNRGNISLPYPVKVGVALILGGFSIVIFLLWFISTKWETTFLWQSNFIQETPLGVLAVGGTMTAVMVVFYAAGLLWGLIKIAGILMQVFRLRAKPLALKIPNHILSLLFTLAVGIVTVWFDYRVINQVESFTVAMWAVACLSISAFSLLLAGFSGNITPSKAEIRNFLIGGPLGGGIAGVYFLSGANVIPFQEQIGNVFIAVGNNVLLFLLWSFLGIIIWDVERTLLKRKKPAEIPSPEQP